MTDDSFQTLHFTFTPVKTFVEQARRTRDLWAGSYLLAWLSGKAMCKILNDGGEIMVPDITDDNLIAALQKQPHDEKLVKTLGTLPNRFTAKIPKGTNPAVYVKTIQEAWFNLAEEVRKKIDHNNQIDAVFWNRQIENLWEITWVLGDKSSLLDSRKNLRLPKQTQECGEKCTVCGERQELSESKEPPPFRPNRERSKNWWKGIKEDVLKKSGGTDLDLRENERLCAVCLTKRAFPLVAKEAMGWEVEKYYPSTAYMSAIDWLETVLEKSKSQEYGKDVLAAANNLVAVANDLKLYYSEYTTDIKSLGEKIEGTGVSKTLIKLDGDTFFQSSIESDQLEKRSSNDKLTLAEKHQLIDTLRQLQNSVGVSTTPFYALLMMDGDGMGKLLGKQDEASRKNVSNALAKFTRQVPGIVEDHNGKLIYAGGDDVFALLPVSSAIHCAAKCREEYREAFKLFPPSIKQAATISAAVQFAHQNIALSVVVKDAHNLLDAVAKDRTGRDALACRVWKPGGSVLTWSQPWQITDGDDLKDIVPLIDKVIGDFHPDRQIDRFSSKFFYKLRDVFELIEGGEVFQPDQVEALLVAEYLSNRELIEADEIKKRDKAKASVKDLLLLCQKQTRKCDDGDQIHYLKGRYNAEAALLVRFLVQKEV